MATANVGLISSAKSLQAGHALYSMEDKAEFLQAQATPMHGEHFLYFFWTYFTGPKIEDLQILSINFRADENRHDMNLHRASLLYTHLVKRVNILFYNVYFKHFSKDSLEPLIRKRQ